MKKLAWCLCGIILFPLVSSAQSGLDTLGLKDIFYEPLLAGKRAEFVRFSTDHSAIFYTANDSAMDEEELFRVSLDGTDRRRVNDSSFVRSYQPSFNHKKIAYSRDGDIWLNNMDFDNPRKVVDTPEWEYNITWGPDSLKFAYVQEGNVMVMDVEDVQIRQITDKPVDAPDLRVIGWAGSNRIIVRQNDQSEVKTTYFPEYIDEYVQPGGSKRGFGIKTISVAYLKADSLHQLYHGKKLVDVAINETGRYAALDIISTGRKERTLKIFDFHDHNAVTVFHDTTDGWFAYTAMDFAPRGSRLMFHSEKDGWNHIYTVNPDGSDLRQITHGNFEIPWTHWLGEEKIIYASTEVDPGERHLYIKNLETGDVQRLTHETGFRQNFHLSRNGQTVVYEYTYFNKPFEWYALHLDDPEGEIRLTHTIPERFTQIDWQKPDYVKFMARDGNAKVSMRVLKPRNIEPGKKYPVVIFVHGAGSLQNVYKGWSNHYWREYMFNQILTANGYFVFQVDYHHSLGYGRDFRDKVTGWMGKYETQDIIDGIKYLAEHYPQADTSRAGIYGGSYGGFMSLYATSVAPEYFDAAAALRVVTNWVNYYRANPWYTKPRLGTPQADSVNYARSSPLTYVDQLKQPVLILHGLMDNNVPFRDAAQYIHKLIQEGDKEFYFMMYPAERHSFEDPDAWYDEYSRIFRFFNRELKKEFTSNE